MIYRRLTFSCISLTLANTSKFTRQGVQNWLMGVQCSSSFWPLAASSSRNCTNCGKEGTTERGTFFPNTPQDLGRSRVSPGPSSGYCLIMVRASLL